VRRRVSVGIVGLGYWGPNLARAFAELPEVELKWLCDSDADTRARLHARYPDARVTPSFDDLIDDDDLDAVVVATPPITHAELALAALRRNKHVFVEKPLALETSDAERVAREASDRGLCLIVGHVLLHHPAIRKLKELLETEELGDVFYLYGNRQNLGKVRRDENALWSLGPHDIAVLLYLLDDHPIEVSARGDCYLQPGIADIVFCHLRFATGITAHLHLSWLDPHKLRKLTVVGSRRMAVVDDMENERKLTIYESNAIGPRSANFGEHVSVRFGDIICPRLPSEEPLRLECEHFISGIRSSAPASASSREGVAVVRVLEALQHSLDMGGKTVLLDRADTASDSWPDDNRPTAPVVMLRG
jgi:predicted dehydrogenase